MFLAQGQIQPALVLLDQMQVQMVMGILHIILVSFLVVMGISPGFGPIIVIASSLGISMFSVLELRKKRAYFAASLTS